MKVSTVAIVVKLPESTSVSRPSLVEVLSDEYEINLLEASCSAGNDDPLEAVHDFRRKQNEEEDEFSGYVEELLSRPFVGSEIQQHGVQWLKSKIRIEAYQKTENDAVRIIAEYALRVVSEDPEKTDFFLAGPKSMVRIRVFPLSSSLAT